MGDAGLQRLKDEVLGLPERERAELVHDVIASLDGLPDQDVEEVWAEEITRRFLEVEAGTVQTVDAGEVLHRIAARLHRSQ